VPKNYHQREKKLWYIVKRCLEKEYGYICSNPYYRSTRKGFIDTGISGARADVIGIKDFKGYYEPKLELVAVEVKDWQDNYTTREMDQTKRASMFAHKCYLAVPRVFKDNEVARAVKTGVGLYEIVDRRALNERLPSPSGNPEDSALLEILAQLGYYRCSTCGCYLNTHFIPKGNGFQPHNKLAEGRQMTRWRFICEVCQKKLPKILGIPSQTDLNYLWNEIETTRRARHLLKTEATNINYLWDEIDRLKKRTKKFQTDLTAWGYYLDRRISKRRKKP
jgi:hypothetical protein